MFNVKLNENVVFNLHTYLGKKQQLFLQINM